MTYKSYLLIVIPILLCGCSSHKTGKIPENFKNMKNLSVYDPGKLPLDSLQFKKEETYGKIYVTGMYTIGPITVVDRKGRVFIEDQGRHTIHVYNTAGSKITDIGRKGRGPGEFVNLTRIKIDKHYLYAYDFILKKISVFSLKSFKLVHTILLKNYSAKIPALKGAYMGNYLARFFVRNDSTILGGFQARLKENKAIYRYYILNWNGEIISNEILHLTFREGEYLEYKVPHGTGRLSLPFGRESLITESGNGNIYTAWTGQFLIKNYNPQGKYKHAFYILFKNRPLTPEGITEVARQRKWSVQNLERVRNADLPGTWPALHSMLLDDTGRLWVSTIVNDSTHYKWWVLNKSGKPVDIFRWPKKEQIEYVRNGSMYVKTIDEQGTIRTVRYEIR